VRSGSFTDRLGSLEAAVQGQNVTAMSEDVRAVMSSLGMDRSVKFDSGDCAFLLTCFIFTMMMTLPGLALFYGGLVRVQNVLSIVMQTFSIACLITVLWIAFGYSLCFSPGGNGLYGDHRNFWLYNVKMDSFHPDFPHVPEAAFILFQLAFAILTPALICGSFADRMRLGPMLVFMAFWHLVVYCPMAHSMWTKFGFLHKLGILDFSGGNVVHVAAGFSGLVSSLVVGKRRGFGRDPFTAHNKLLSVMGMYACIYIYVYTHTHTHTHVYIYIYIYICIYIYMYVCMYIYMCVCVCVCVCVYVCMYVCMYIYIYIYIYIRCVYIYMYIYI